MHRPIKILQRPTSPKAKVTYASVVNISRPASPPKLLTGRDSWVLWPLGPKSPELHSSEFVYGHTPDSDLVKRVEAWRTDVAMALAEPKARPLSQP